MDELFFALGPEGIGGIFAVVAAAIGFLGVILGSRKGRAEEKAKAVHYLVQAADVVLQTRGDEITRLAAKTDKLEIDLASCEARHDGCEKRVDELDAKVTAFAQIDAMMRGPVAGYTIGPAG